jgi:hypothetical protein
MLRTIFGITLLAVLPTTTAWAQTPGGVSSELERTASTSTEEKTAYASVSNAEISEAEKAVAKSLETARKGGDAQVIECVLSRLTAIRALQSVSQNAEGAMKTAIAAGEEEKANHEYRKIAVALAKTRQLRGEANQCDSTNGEGGGSTIVDWQSFLDNNDGVFDDWDLDELDIVVEPPQVSPFL